MGDFLLTAIILTVFVLGLLFFIGLCLFLPSIIRGFLGTDALADERHAREQQATHHALQEWEREQQEYKERQRMEKEHRRMEKEQWRRERARQDAEFKQHMEMLDQLEKDIKRAQSMDRQLLDDLDRHLAEGEQLLAELRKQEPGNRS